MSFIDVCKKVFFNRYVILVFLIISVGTLFQPTSLAYLSSLAPLVSWYEWGRLLSLIVIAIVYIRFGKKDLFALLSVLLVATCCLSSYINQKNFIPDLYMWEPCIAIVLLVAITAKEHFRDLLISVMAVTGILCVLNLTSMFLFPEGMYETPTMQRWDCFFWGHRNSSYVLFIPAVLSSCILDSIRSRVISVRSVILLVISILMVTIKLSMTSLLAFLVLVLGIIAIQFPALRKYINGYSVLASYFVLFVCIVVLRLQVAFDPLFGLFGKNATFTSRTEIWDYVIAHLIDPSHIAFGYGSGFAGGFTAANQYIGSAHNMILHVMLLGGLVAGTIFIALLVVSAKMIYRYRSNPVAAFIALGMASLFIVGLTENVATKATLFLFLALANYCSFGLRENDELKKCDSGSSHISQS